MSTSVLVARLAGPAGRGTITTLVTWMQLLGWAGSMSLDKAVVVFTSDGRIAPRVALASARGAVLLTHLPIGVAAIAIGGRLFTVSWYPFLLLAGAWITSHSELVAGWVLASGREARFALLRLSQPIIYLALCLGIGAASALLGHNDVTVWLAVATVVSLAFPLVMGPWRPFVRKPASRLALLRVGGAAHVATIFQYLNSRIDILVLSATAAPRVVGVYALGMALGRAPVFVAAAAATRGLTGRGSLVDTRALVAITSLGIIVAGMAPVAIPLVVGPAFRRSVLVAQILALGSPADYLQQSWSGRLLHFRQTSALIRAQVAGTLVFVAGIMVSRLDWWVASVSVVSYALSAVILGLAVRKAAAVERSK